MLKQNLHKNIYISIFGYDNKKIAALNYALKKFEHAEINALSAEGVADADILLFDIDSENARKQLDTIHSNVSIKPIIIVSHKPVELNNTISILKPISSDKLFSAVEQGLKIIAGQLPYPKTIANNSLSKSDLKEKEQQPLVSSTPEKSAYELGSASQVDMNSVPRVKAKVEFFNSNEGLLGLLAHLYKEKQAAVISLNNQQQKILYVIPQTNSIYICIPLTEVQLICKQQLSVSFSTIELETFHPGSLAKPISKAHLDRFVWQVAISTSKGCVPKVINLQKSKLGLKFWPNLTRYKSNTDFLRFAAFFSQTPTNLNLADKLLKPKSVQLFQFVSACHALGILTISESTKPLTSPAVLMPKSSKRGVLAQIFKRLTTMMK
ncbi:MAG: hypothetical protein QM479_07560 [Pseudomonadota bacterium]